MAFTVKKTIGQKRKERQGKIARTIAKPKTNDRYDKIIAEINKQLGGQGRVFRGSDYQKREYDRRTTGIPTLDYITNGGLPKGGLVEIGGAFSSGKSTAALHICAEEQKRQWAKDPDKRKGIGWVALEPFSKQYARECGFFIPYSDDECFDPATGEVGKLDSLERASSLELLRLEKMGVEDPYAELCPLVVVQEERGDVALDAALTMLRSNLFEIVVVDSLGVAKQTTWIEEKEVQDSADFSREPKMIGDYTTRALLALNARYDESNQIAKDGKYFNNTTLVHLNHVGMAIGTQSHTPWNAYRIKGGEGNKHNHHAIIFLWRSGAPLFIEKPGQPRYMYGQEMNAICIKSKIGPPWMQGSYDYYFQKHDRFLPGDINIAKDAVTLGLIAGLVQRAGSWFEYKGVRTQGREGLENALWKDTESVKELAQEAIKVLRR
jgi:recombination protein RecA